MVHVPYGTAFKRNWILSCDIFSKRSEKFYRVIKTKLWTTNALSDHTCTSHHLYNLIFISGCEIQWTPTEYKQRVIPFEPHVRFNYPLMTCRWTRGPWRSLASRDTFQTLGIVEFVSEHVHKRLNHGNFQANESIFIPLNFRKKLTNLSCMKPNNL